MSYSKHKRVRFLRIPLLLLAVLLGFILFRQHVGFPASISTRDNTPWNLILVNNGP